MFSHGVEILRRTLGGAHRCIASPFDYQVLTTEVAAKQGNDQVTLQALQDKLDFSKPAEGLTIEGAGSRLRESQEVVGGRLVR